MDRSGSSMMRLRPACVGVEGAAQMFGWPKYYLPFLVRAGHLKPLGKPAQNSRKWFATVELERLSADVEWLDKAIRIVEKRIQDMNRKESGKGELALAEYRPGLGGLRGSGAPLLVIFQRRRNKR